jgi:fimbrial isopeptide formation D2 family protein/LPXTG-motif cell wall-anchored protein
MKLVRKIMAIVTAWLMVFTMSATAFAATGDKLAQAENTIYANDVHQGDTVVYYQVVEWTDRGWALKAPFNTISGLTVDILAAENGITDALAKTIADAATGAGTPMTVGNPSTTYYAQGVEPGLYYLKATATTSVDTVYNPAFVSADYFEGGNSVSFNSKISNTAVLKSSTITLDKEVTGEDKFKDTKPGDTIPYKITTKIPSYGDTFTDPTFSITDTFSDGLALLVDDEHPVTVTYGNTTVTDSDSNVTFTGATNGASTFTIAFAKDYLTALAGNQPSVTITYYGTVTTTATANVTYMDNTATLTYSNSPTTKDSKEDKTRHYTFTIDGSLLGGTEEITDELLKIGVDSNGSAILGSTVTHHGTDVSPLGGATFSLTPASGTTMNDPNPRTAVSTAYGYITFAGLDEGTYTLKETAAPAGYIKDPTEYTVTITPYWNASIPDLLDRYEVVITDGTTTVTANFTMTNTGETVKKKTTASGMPNNGQFITNTQGTELPSTGGIGTTIFYIVGGVMVAGAVVFLLTKRRVAGNE